MRRDADRHTPAGYRPVVPAHDLDQVLADADAEAWVLHSERLEDMVIFARFLAEVRDGAAGPWRQRAACKGQTALMFPERGEPAAPGLALCERCEVQRQCRAWAATQPAPEHGTAAGETARARARRRIAAKRAA